MPSASRCTASPAFTASVCNLNPESRGSVRIRSPRADDAPLIAPSYLATDGDRRVAAQSLRLTRRIVAQPALARFAPVEIKPGAQYRSPTRNWPDSPATSARPSSTRWAPARWAATTIALAVVDARLRVRGVAGLRGGRRQRDAHASPAATPTRRR